MIKTERLNILPSSDEQMKQLIEEQTQPELRQAYRQMLNGCLEHTEHRQWYAIWRIQLNNESKAIVGNMSFKGLQSDGALEIGYGANPSFEGMGYMTEAVTALVRWAVEQDGVTRIEAEAKQSNTASIRVLEKSGFVLNGIMGEEGPRYVWKP